MKNALILVLFFSEIIIWGMKRQNFEVPLLSSLALQFVTKNEQEFDEQDIGCLPLNLKSRVLAELHKKILKNKTLRNFIKEVPCVPEKILTIAIDNKKLEDAMCCYEDAQRKIFFKAEEFGVRNTGYLICQDKTTNNEQAVEDGLPVTSYTINGENNCIAFTDVVSTVVVYNPHNHMLKKFIMSDIIESVAYIGFIPHTDLLYISAHCCDHWPRIYIWNYNKDISITLPCCAVQFNNQSKESFDFSEHTTLSLFNIDNISALPLHFLQQGLGYGCMKLLLAFGDFYEQLAHWPLTRHEIKERKQYFNNWLDEVLLEPMIKEAYKKIMTEKFDYFIARKGSTFCNVS